MYSVHLYVHITVLDLIPNLLNRIPDSNYYISHKLLSILIKHEVEFDGNIGKVKIAEELLKYLNSISFRNRSPRLQLLIRCYWIRSNM